MKNTDFGAEVAWFDVIWTSYLILLCLSFFICKVDTLVPVMCIYVIFI